MPRYRVRVRQYVTREVEVEVDGSDLSDAQDAARDLAVRMSFPVKSSRVESEVVAQIGEPWVNGDGWDKSDMTSDKWPAGQLSRPDRYMQSEDLLVFKRSHGNLFTEAEVAVLKERAARIVGLSVAECWNGITNGIGHGTLSIRMSSSFPLLTRDQINALLAPIEKAEA